MSKWYERSGEQGDIVLSSRIRLARNLTEYPFPGRMSAAQEQELTESVSSFLCGSAGGSEFHVISLADEEPGRRGELVERHLISPELASKSGARCVILSEDESVSIMVNEEDHLRIQVMGSGLALQECLERANQLDDLLDGHFQYAWNERLGYLTHCPTNLGTGLRASVMLHLPAHDATGETRRLLSQLSKMGFTLRGLYGEGSAAVGSIYQISNQITLGTSEAETLERLTKIVTTTIERERALRGLLSRNAPGTLEDAAWRAYGILSYARQISSAEAMKLLSDLRIGVSLGEPLRVTLGQLNRLSSEIQPHSVSAGQKLSDAQRDQRRAELLRTALQGGSDNCEKE